MIELQSTTAMTSRDRWTEWALRSFAIAAYLLMLLAIFNNWRVNEHAYSLLMLLITEAFTLAIIVLARSAVMRDASPLNVIAVVYTSSYFLFLDPSDAIRVIPESAAAVIQGAGLAFTVVAKATIGRMFGILPAVRGIVTTGPYRIVRHPIYLGYAIGNVGFYLANASVRNALILGTLLLTQFLRIAREEAVFNRSAMADEYKAYSARVRFRLIPKVF